MGPLVATTLGAAPRAAALAPAPRIVHVITSLEEGGAQAMLQKLLAADGEQARSARVIALTDGGAVAPRIAALGVPVRSLGMTRGRPSPAGLPRLVRMLRDEAPDLIQTWLYHADLLGGVAAALLRIPVVWSVRHDRLLSTDSRLTWLTRRACALLSSRVPSAIVCNSEASRRTHAAAGYDPARLRVVPNGFDLARFRPDAAARTAVRAELGVADATPLVGMVARFHPHKDHATFLAAAALVKAAVPPVEFVLCGEDVDGANPALASLVHRAAAGALGSARLAGSVHLLGKRSDVERITAALDVACLTSRTESFPNVLGEAMACGVPCVATDCGDVREIAGQVARVVPIGDAAAVAREVVASLRLDAAARAAIAEAGRARVKETYDVNVVAEQLRQIQREALR